MEKGEYHHVLKFSHNSNVKPDKPTKEMPGTALSIWVRHLTTGTCHRERWLSGVVIEDAIFTGGIYFVMKDAIGDLVKIGVYNIPNASPAAAAHRFPCGKCVTIVEPYLKTGIDGSAFVRVDDPATDVLTDSHVLPGCDAAAWQLEGNQLFAANMTAEAFECWSRALSFAAASSTVSTLLTQAHCGWPKGVDIEWAKSHLHFVFEQCSSLPYSMQLGFSGETFEFQPEDLLKRANGQPARLKWLLSNKELKFGDVMPEELVGTITYPQFLRQPFTNQAYRQELLSLGTVHVAVGFVDLGVLLSCDVGEAPKGRTGPLRFVGVELSCFAVAKSLAIWQMIKDAANSKTSADAILQVWFSSTWLPSTHDSFRSAARAVRSQGDKLYGSNGSVSKLLEHWAASRGISLKRARTEWAETVMRGGSGIGNMKQLDDRLDLAAYELTGDVFVGDSAQLTGSICWWDCPDGTPANQFDQTFLSAINVAIVLKERSSGQSFFHAAESFLLRRVAKLITWAGSGAIKLAMCPSLFPKLPP